jgi:hypothetical protein
MAPRIRSHEQRAIALRLLAISLLAFSLRFAGLGAAPLTDDEKWSLAQAVGFSFADLPPGGVTTDVTRLARWTGVSDVLHRIGAFDQPVFIVLTHYVVRFLGPSEWAIRLLPALMGAVTPVLLFAWARRFVDAPTAFLATALLAAHPFHVTLSRFGRVYTLAIACLLVGYLVPHEWRGRWHFVPYGFALGLQPLTHLLSGFGSIPHLVYLRFEKRISGRLLLASVALGSALLVLALPFGVADSILTEHLHAGLVPRSVIGLMALQPRSFAVSVTVATTTLMGLDVDPLGGRIRYMLPILAGFLFLCHRGAARLSGATRLMLVVGAVLPSAVVAALSLFYGHVIALLPQYSVWSLPFLIVLLALGLGTLPKRRAVSACLLAGYLMLAIAAIRSPRPGYSVDVALRLGACSTADDPLSVWDPLDGFVAASERSRPVYLSVRPARADDALRLGSTFGCARAGFSCAQVPSCPDFVEGRH